MVGTRELQLDDPALVGRVPAGVLLEFSGTDHALHINAMLCYVIQLEFSGTSYDVYIVVMLCYAMLCYAMLCHQAGGWTRLQVLDCYARLGYVLQLVHNSFYSVKLCYVTSA